MLVVMIESQTLVYRVFGENIMLKVIQIVGVNKF